MDRLGRHIISAKVANALPEVSCSQPFGVGCDVYKVMDKVFLFNTQLQGIAICNLKVKPDDGIMLREYYNYIHAGWHMNKRHWISVYETPHLDPDLVADLVHSSYDLVVSKLNKIQQQRIALLKSVQSF